VFRIAGHFPNGLGYHVNKNGWPAVRFGRGRLILKIEVWQEKRLVGTTDNRADLRVIIGGKALNYSKSNYVQLLASARASGIEPNTVDGIAAALRPHLRSSIIGQRPNSSQRMIKTGIGMPKSQSSAYRILLPSMVGAAEYDIGAS
jgi:hypothetical protein